MLLTLRLPRINELMTTAVILTLHVPEEAALSPGTKLLDVRVDLSGSVAHDCPPISHFRIVVGDRVWLRRMSVARDEKVAAGALLALFSTEPNEPLDTAPVREVRISVAGILDPSDWWDSDES